MDEKQFADILEIYQSAVISVLYKMIHSWETARDLAQESFIKLWYYRDRIDKDKPVFTLVYKIAVNLAIDHIRKNKYKLNELEVNLATSSDDNIESQELYQLIIAISNKLKP